MEREFPEKFSVADIAKELNIKIPRIQEWIRLKFITPKWPAKGRGGKHVCDIVDFYRISLFKGFVNDGWKRKHAAREVRLLFKREEEKQKERKKND